MKSATSTEIAKERKQIVVFPRGQLSKNDKERMSRHGVLAIEADDPSKVVTVIPGVMLADSNDMLSAAVQTLANWAKADTYKRTPASDFVIALSNILAVKK